MKLSQAAAVVLMDLAVAAFMIQWMFLVSFLADPEVAVVL